MANNIEDDVRYSPSLLCTSHIFSDFVPLMPDLCVVIAHDDDVVPVAYTYAFGAIHNTVTSDTPVPGSTA
jgi:hypothetical protein